MQSRDERIGNIDDLLRELFGKYLRPPDPPPAGELNITMGQMHCLGTIAHLGDPTMSQLAEALGLHPSTVTVLVDGLESHGLARRKPDPRDRRVVRVSETAKGRRNHERHMAMMRGRLIDMLSGVTDGDLTQIESGLLTMHAAARRYFEAASGSEQRPQGAGK